MHAAAAVAKLFQSCQTLCNPIDGSPPGSPIPGILQAKNTGVGCHFLLQCMKMKSESEVTQSCPILCDPMDCSLPGSSVHGFSRQQYWNGVPSPSRFGCIDIYNCFVFLLDWSLDHYVVFFLNSCNLYFEVYFVWYEDCYSSFLLLPICIKYIFPSSHFHSICVFRSQVGFL